jgi:hypothetical protein
MAELKFADLLILNGSDQKRQVLDMASISDVGSLNRIVEAGLSDEQGKLTGKGVKAVEMVKKIIGQIVEGIPLRKRKYFEAEEVEKSKCGVMEWMFGEYQKKVYVTNSEIIMIGRPVKSMHASEGRSSVRKNAGDLINSHTSGKNSEFVELVKFLYQLDMETATQFIWMASKDGKRITAIQAKYFDYMKKKYPSCSFFVNVKKPQEYPVVQVRVLNRGWKNNVVGLIMTLDIQGMQIPQFDKFE